MGECRGEGGGGDGLIKLFGKTIPVPEACDVAAAKDLEQHSGTSSAESHAQQTAHQDAAAAANLSPQPEVVDADDPATADDTVAGEKEKLKKPDKILPCPRCSSMDTKFCYFNNYNVNQPRHFCKNCQRYWTAGGAMRNVPVGAGRRKNKNAAAVSHFLQRVRAGDPPVLASGNGTVLSFGHDAADLADQMTHLKEKLIPVGRAGNADNNPSMGSCSEVSSSRDDQNQSSNRGMDTVEKPANGMQHPSIHGGTIWPYSCAPSPAYYAPGIAIPMYHAAPAYWGCMVPGAWSLPWPVQSPSPPTIAPSVSSGTTNSLTLGKHPREGDDEGRSHGNGSGKVWVPKTIRIDNADEVARSSIWSMLGIKGDKEEAGTSGHRLSTMFEPKRDAKAEKHAVITSLPFLHANPIAFTRSATFQEGS